jgi:SAM-dependent methyltransferase
MRRLLARLRRLGLLGTALASAVHRGRCPVCERRTVFVKAGHWLRDLYYCARCASLPRSRALVHVLGRDFPTWRALRIHESSPTGASSAKLARECPGYVATHLLPGVAPGQVRDGCRCEDLQAQTFADTSFDLVVTQDVFEHVLDPARAFAEVARTLKPGGAHVFTLPWHYWKPTLVRARPGEDGITHLQPAEYHQNPIDPRGALVVTDWGSDLIDFIARSSGLSTTVVHLSDPSQGIAGDFCDVFVSRKPA